jgi:quercetin dioxygenase-like cupin family protein
MFQTTDGAPLDFCGSLATIRLSHAGRPDGIAVIENDLPYGYATPLHIHVNQDEVFHVLQGRLCVEVDGRLIHADAGDVLMAPKGVPHRFIVISPEDARVLVFTVGGDFETFVRDASTPLAAGATPQQPTEAVVERVTRAAGRNGIELIGQPLSLDDTRLRAA